MAAIADAFSSLCVGGTFMVVTLAVIQEARRVAPANSASLIATMTAAFAIDQILGPILVSFVANEQRDLDISLIAASTLLVLSALALSLSGVGERQRVRASHVCTKGSPAATSSARRSDCANRM